MITTRNNILNERASLHNEHEDSIVRHLQRKQICYNDRNGIFVFQVPFGENREISAMLIRAHRCELGVAAGHATVFEREGGRNGDHKSEDLPEKPDNVRCGKSALL